MWQKILKTLERKCYQNIYPQMLELLKNLEKQVQN